MATYTVHVPQAFANEAEAAERTLFVRDGFSLSAAVFGPLWLLWNRLWLAALGWVLIMAAVGAGGWALSLPDQTVGSLLLLFAILLGFEGSSLIRWKAARRGYDFAGVVAGRHREDCERRFFAGWLERRPGRSGPATPRPAALEPRLPQGVERAPPVLGLFPEPGGRR